MSQKARNIRYLILLLILLAVAGNEMMIKLKVASWDQTLQVRVYAINADSRSATNSYIKKLGTKDFRNIEVFINGEARRYGIDIDAVKVEYAGELLEIPPQPPLQGSVLENVFWSLHFRGWAWYWGMTTGNRTADVNLFVNYFDLATTQALQHSVGLRGGLIGLINAFADNTYRGSNNVVIAHELMHTFGASDKYDASNQPIRPDGYADAYQDPLYPQKRAEIMGGRIPLSPTQSRMPESLSDVAVGVFSAAEMHWPLDY